MIVKGDQFAIVVSDVDDYIASAGKAFEHVAWVRDTVLAATLFDHDVKPEMGSFPSVRYEIAFNYDMIPALEFEIIRPISGRTVHSGLRPGSIGHVGCHLPEGKTFMDFLETLRAQGGIVGQIFSTTQHSSSKRFYQYAYVWFPNVPFPVKVIQRLDNEIGLSNAKVLQELYWGMFGGR